MKKANGCYSIMEVPILREIAHSFTVLTIAIKSMSLERVAPTSFVLFYYFIFLSVWYNSVLVYTRKQPISLCLLNRPILRGVLWSLSRGDMHEEIFMYSIMSSD